VVDHELDDDVGGPSLLRQHVAQGALGGRDERELQVVHRSGAVRLLARLVVLAGAGRAVDHEREGAVEPLRLEEKGLALRLVVDLDEDRCRELVIARDELVVGHDLVRDRRLARDALGAEHLLDLHERGVVALEDARRLRSQRDSTRLLLRDDAATELIANALVLGESEDLVALHWLHGDSGR